MSNATYENFFQRVTGHPPHPWQVQLGQHNVVTDRLIRIPTGMGKTAGVLAAWAYNRLENPEANSATWPTRLVWCLPMRTLVEQTEAVAHSVLDAAGYSSEVSVQVLLGGRDEARWIDAPEQPAILIGTQDMLLSRALNRGYAMGRAAWPRAFGLLNHDALWVMDEVQLMGVGLATSAQLQALWHGTGECAAVTPRPRATWWMSATLQPDWLKTHQTQESLPKLVAEQLRINPRDRVGGVWDTTKPLTRLEQTEDSWAATIVKLHTDHVPNDVTGRQTLVVVNRVNQAIELYKAIEKLQADNAKAPELRIVHSRFRPNERKMWRDSLLSRKNCAPDTNRILIATQVVEAGVDITASCLVSQIAPWPSLVQRFGRSARYGGSAEVIVLDPQHVDEKQAAPYSLAVLDSARKALEQLRDVGIKSLETFEEQLNPAARAELYPYDPLHILQPDELEELFDTSPDLSGADMDISRFIREGDERDLYVVWQAWEGKAPPMDWRPIRDEVCSISIADAKAWLPKVRKRGHSIYAWDYLDGLWQTADVFNLRPGMTILVQPEAGGYSQEFGFTGEAPNKKSPVVPVTQLVVESIDADGSEQNDALSVVRVWKTIATHCREAEQVAVALCEKLSVADVFRPIVAATLRLHDWGKAHPAFAQGTYRVTPERTDLAKAPADAWPVGRQQLYHTPSHGHRKGFRHELASCLAVMELLRAADAMQPAFLGPHAELLVACGMLEENFQREVENSATSGELTEELSRWSAEHVNLLLFLIASHHGKVRVSLQASALDQDFPHDRAYVGTGLPIRGVRQGDVIPSVDLPTPGGFTAAPEVQLDLAAAGMGLSARYGASWTERVEGLLRQLGPFKLAYLEAIVRAADCGASDDSQPPGNEADPRLKGVALDVVVANGKPIPDQAMQEPAHAQPPPTYPSIRRLLPQASGALPKSPWHSAVDR